MFPMSQFSLGAFYCYGWVEISSYKQQAKVNRLCKIPGQKSLSGNPMLCSTICLAAGSKECALRIVEHVTFSQSKRSASHTVAVSCKHLDTVNCFFDLPSLILQLLSTKGQCVRYFACHAFTGQTISTAVRKQMLH